MEINMQECAVPETTMQVPGCEVVGDYTVPAKLALLYDTAYITESCKAGAVSIALHTLLQHDPVKQLTVAAIVSSAVLLYIVCKRMCAWRLGKNYKCLRARVIEPADLPFFCKLLYEYEDGTLLILTKVKHARAHRTKGN